MQIQEAPRPTEEELRWYLQRAQDFHPEMAVLLIDTNSSIEEPIKLLNRICADMERKHRALVDPTTKERPQTSAEIFQRRNKKELWWGGGNRFITNVINTRDASLMAVLRLYHNEVQHYTYPWGPPEYVFDYVAGQVSKLKE